MRRVLIVEPDRGERLVLANRLEAQDLDVVSAETSAEGLQELRSRPFDLVLIASELGEGHDGPDLCRQMKALPDMSSVPVMIYGGEPSAVELQERAYANGCDSFLSRPQMPAIDRVALVLLRIKARSKELTDQHKQLAGENSRLLDECRGKDRASKQGNARRSPVAREPIPGRPDGLLVVDREGRVHQADRGGHELLGPGLLGKTLGSLVPATGLEAFVRDARNDARDGFRFDVAARTGRSSRALMASVTPMTSDGRSGSDGLRVVLLFDLGRRRWAEQVMRTTDAMIPHHQLGTLMEAARKVFSPKTIVGTSDRTAAYRSAVTEMSAGSRPVLLRGERGTGKVFAARVLHYSGNASGSFLHLRCGALSPESLDREIFGYAAGAFPGAVTDRQGLVKLAQEGTLFLAEIGELPLHSQERLLSVLKTGRVLRAGAQHPEAVRLRVVASTHRDLWKLAEAGLFLRALLAEFADNVLDVPPLRERIKDLPAITRDYIARFACCKQVHALSDAAMWTMQQYPWPGNTVELESCIEHACSATTDGIIEVEHLTLPLRELYEELPDKDLIPASRPVGTTARGTRDRNERIPADWEISEQDPVSLDLYERKVLLRALHVCGGDRLAAARLLKVGKSTLYRKLSKFQIR